MCVRERVRVRKVLAAVGVHVRCFIHTAESALSKTPRLVCAVYVLYMCCICALYVLYTCCICAVYVLYMCCTRAVYVLYTHVNTPTHLIHHHH